MRWPRRNRLLYNARVVRTLGASLLVLWLAAGCAGAGGNAPTQIGDSAVIPAPTTISAPSLWISPLVPDELRHVAEGAGIPAVSDREMASLILDQAPSDQGPGSEWIYALAAPFPTILDGVSTAELKAVWGGSSTAAFAAWPLWMTSSTRQAITRLWGEPAVDIKIASPDRLLEEAWNEIPSWAIVPFEAIEPQWKILTIDGQSPIRKDFDSTRYPLRVRFALAAANGHTDLIQLPDSNRDAALLTTVMLTGTSGLVREIAYQMEVKGIAYPARDIGASLREADILHISHETPFEPNCPPPNPLKNRFYCGSPGYIGLFDDVGLDVVELTGNHTMDSGIGSFLYTLDLYRQHGIAYYGGGANLADARRPLLLEHNGNRIAFLGCNFAEPPQPLAAANTPGANPCDWKALTAEVEALRAQAYLPIVTLQYREGYSPVVMPWQSIDFRRAADAGAAIVSGSQSHVPLQMEFYKGAFIHYGLGNLFFGQMANQPPGPGLPLQPAERYEFLDRHVLYAGRYISTELLTAMLEDYGRPRMMTTDEREETLRAYFGYSGWMQLIPTPAPKKTPTPYPLLKFVPLPTYTPSPKATSAP